MQRPKLAATLLLQSVLSSFLILSPFQWIVTAQSLPPAKQDGFFYKNRRVDSDTIVVEAFFDPVCPDSRDAWPPLKQALEHYGSRVSLVVHLLPLPYHDNAYATSRALHIVNTINPSTTFRLLEWFFKYQERFYNAPTHNMSRASVVDEIVKFSAEAIGNSYLSAIESGFNDRIIGFVAECTRTAYVQSGTELHIRGKKRIFPVGQVVDVPAAESFVRLRVGDLLIISRDSSCEHNESPGTTSGAHRVTCSSGYLFDSVKSGDPIAFDDGKIWGVIKGASISEIVVSITHAGPRGTKLGSEKSINIPESNIWFEGLTSKDLMDLDFVASHADMVGISFVRDVRDIVVLRQELEKRKFQNLGIVLKIETKSGFEKLPLMLLEAMKSSNPLGVMIARGDLAVECGWERLADIQDEILSICGAAHVPVIWATQVLESLVKSGVPTRAEITDAANGKRASCVMLNKGQNIVEAVSTLDTILHIKTTKMKADLKPLLLSSHLF